MTVLNYHRMRSQPFTLSLKQELWILYETMNMSEDAANFIEILSYKL